MNSARGQPRVLSNTKWMALAEHSFVLNMPLHVSINAFKEYHDLRLQRDQRDSFRLERCMGNGGSEKGKDLRLTWTEEKEVKNPGPGGI